LESVYSNHIGLDYCRWRDDANSLGLFVPLME
jgi:hypothetical protein